MKQTLLLAVLATTVLAGCASQHKLTQPSGRWQTINQAGFVPANAERFYQEVMQQAVAKATTEVAKPLSEFGQSAEEESKLNTQPTEAPQ